MNRTDFQQLAEVRVREAEALLAAGLWDGAYYLAGYAVECGLKACIAKLTQAEEFPPPRKKIEVLYSHNLPALLDATGLQTALDTSAPPGSPLAKNWAFVKDWSEQARYERFNQSKAAQLIAAVTDPTDGVLSWIRKHW